MSTSTDFDERGYLNPPPIDPQQPRVSLMSAVGRHWVVAAIPVVLLVALAVAAALARTPNYTADTRLAVGRLDASTPASLVGFTQAAQSLAETYSRSIRNEAVLNPAAARLGVSPAVIRAKVSAAPIPESPVFRIRAEGDSASDAVRISTALSESFVRYTKRLGQTSSGSQGLLRRYRDAQLILNRERGRVDDLRREIVDAPSTEVSAALAEARTRAAEGELRAESLRLAYTNSLQSAGAAGIASIVEPAVGADSDKTRVLQLLVFVGLMTGLAIGIALALLRANRQGRRGFS